MKLALTHTKPKGAALAVALPLLLLALAAAPPFLGEPVRGALMHAFAPACHQIAERSFSAAGVPFALCHRCTGFVGGLAAGAALLLVLGGARGGGGGDDRGGVALLLAVAFLPMALDWGGGVLGVWENTPLSRVATGGWAGGGLGLLIAYTLSKPARPRLGVEEVVGES